MTDRHAVLDPSLRHLVETHVPALASSIDGRRFGFECSLHGLELEAGGYVEIGGESDRRLGQIHTLAHDWVDASRLDVKVSGESLADLTALRVGIGRGSGVILSGDGEPFYDAPLAPASADAVAAWLDAVRPARAALDVGALTLVPSLRYGFDAGGFDRHTFLCGQSGSGKTYALGTVLEQLLLETSIRIVVLDPNSDFVRLGDLRTDVEATLAKRYADAAAGVEVRRAAVRGESERLHVRFTDCDAEEQAAVLRLDPIANREEYGALVEMLERVGTQPVNESAEALMERMLAADSPGLQALGARLRNLGIYRWKVWSTGDAGALQDLVGPDGPRCLVVDLGSLATPGEQAIAAEAVLAGLWRGRADRRPTLVVIDEAHNVCPREPGDPVTALASELAIRIAAEGRKFGLYLLVSTQRPQRVHELVVSQCDNLLLMRMNAAGDLDFIARTLSFAPRPLLERSTSFRLGESLVAGKLSSHPALVRFGPRLSEEGGSDVPATWSGAA